MPLLDRTEALTSLIIFGSGSVSRPIAVVPYTPVAKRNEKKTGRKVPADPQSMILSDLKISCIYCTWQAFITMMYFPTTKVILRADG